MDGDGRLGLRVARYRDLAGLTQQQLADAVGKTQAYIAMIESGKRRVVTRPLLMSLAEALRVPVGDLVRRTSPDAGLPDDAIHAAIPMIRAAFDGAQDPADRPWQALVRDTQTMQITRMACDYSALAGLLPGLLADTGGGADDPRLAGLHVRVCVNAAIAVRPLGYLDLAVRMAERAQRDARTLNDPVLIAAADFAAAQASLAGGMRTQAVRSLKVARAAANQIGSLITDDARVWYGMSNLQAALSAAAVGQADEAHAHLAEADRIAATAPQDHWVQDFSSANVSIWRLAIALESGDPASAVAAVHAADLGGLRTKQRRARFYGDAGRAYFLAGQYDDAIAALLTGLDISATDVRSRAVLRVLTGRIVLSGHRHPHLHSLVIRLGIDPLELAQA